MACWDVHRAMMNHRSAWAEEARAPDRKSYLAEQDGDDSMDEREPRRRVVADAQPSGAQLTAASAAEIEVDTLVVVSKVKKLIKDQSDFNTSQCCIDALTKKVVDECRKAIEQARIAGRKTVMGRDVR